MEIVEIKDIECSYDKEKEEFFYLNNIAKENKKELVERIISSTCNTSNDLNSSIYKDF
jgi:hypothetical protein